MSDPIATRPRSLRQPQTRVALAIGLAVGLFVLGDSCIRLALDPHPAGPLQFVAEHGNLAAALVHGEGFSNPFGTPSGPTAWTPPAFPLYLAAVFAVFGVKTMASLKVLLALDAVLAGVTVGGTCLLLDFAGWPQAKIASALLLAALHLLDEHVMGGLMFQTQWFVAAENAAFLACLCGAYYQTSLGWRVGLALLTALIPITHAGSGLACVVGVAIFAASAGLRERRAGAPPSRILAAVLAFAALPAACFTLTVGGWTARNWFEFGHFIPLKSAGWFEVYLTQTYTRDGVLDEAVMVGHHPFSNPKLLVDYTLNGEALFLKEFEAKARAAIAADPGKYWRGIAGRAANVFCYCNTDATLAICEVERDPADARTIVAADLAARLTQPLPIWWTSLNLSPAEFHERLYALRVADKPRLEENWSRAKEAMLDLRSLPSRILMGLSLSSLPAIAILLGLLLAKPGPGLAMASAWTFYVVAQLPNVLITHYSTHSLHFRAFHALAIGFLLTLAWER